MELVTELIKCAICLDSFDCDNHQPRCFPCGHSFGHSCIQGLKQASTKKCPTCKSDINLSTDPPINFQLKGILDACKNASTSNSNQQKQSSLCSKCNRAHPSLRTCITCDFNPILCPHCARYNHNGHSFLSFDSSQQKQDAILALKRLEKSLASLRTDTEDLCTKSIDLLKKLQKECNSEAILRSMENMAEVNPKEAEKSANEASEIIETMNTSIVQLLNPLGPILESISFDLAGVNQNKEDKERESADLMLALTLSMEEDNMEDEIIPHQDLIRFD